MKHALIGIALGVVAGLAFTFTLFYILSQTVFAR